MHRIYFLYIFSIFLGSCKAQTSEEKMLSTTNAILKSFETKDAQDFQNFIGVSLRQIGKTDEMIGNDFNKIKPFIVEYSKNKKPKIEITDGYNDLGSKKVLIDFDDNKAVSEIELQLFFGPPNFVPLNKISNYKIIVNKNIPTSPVIAPATNDKQN